MDATASAQWCALYTIDGLYMSSAPASSHHNARAAGDCISSSSTDRVGDCVRNVAVPSIEVGQQLVVLYRLFLRLHHACCGDMEIDALLKAQARPTTTSSTTSAAAVAAHEAAAVHNAHTRREHVTSRSTGSMDDHDDAAEEAATAGLRDDVAMRALSRPPLHHSVVHEAERWLLCRVPTRLRRVTMLPYFLLPVAAAPPLHQLRGYADWNDERQEGEQSSTQHGRQGNSNYSANGADELLVRCGVAACGKDGGGKNACGLGSGDEGDGVATLAGAAAPANTEAAVTPLCVPAELLVVTSRRCWSCVSVELSATAAHCGGGNTLVFCCAQH